MGKSDAAAPLRRLLACTPLHHDTTAPFPHFVVAKHRIRMVLWSNGVMDCNGDAYCAGRMVDYDAYPPYTLIVLIKAALDCN